MPLKHQAASAAVAGDGVVFGSIMYSATKVESKHWTKMTRKMETNILIRQVLTTAVICCLLTNSLQGAGRVSVRGTRVGGEHSRVKRVIGGSSYEKGKWPWLVSLQGAIPSKMFLGIPVSYQRYYCGASLLNDRWILTAAHCFVENEMGSKALEPRYWHAKLGKTELKSTVMERMKGFFGRILKVDELREAHWLLHAQRIVIHPEYNRTNMWQHDIALLKLEEDVPSGDDIQPHIQSVNLVNSNNQTFPSTSTNCIMMGWGCTKNGGPVVGVAHDVIMPKVSDQQCASYWGISPIYRFCAGRTSTSSFGICSGDSGGPMVCQDGNDWIQVGIASFTSASKPGEVPGVFTRVSKYVDWIREVIIDDFYSSLSADETYRR